MRPQFSLSLLALVARSAVSDVAFVYSPTFVSTTDFSSNIVMVEGDFKVIQWANVSNPKNARISITIFQLNGTQFFGDAEYVTLTSTLHSIKCSTTSSASGSQTSTFGSPPTTTSATSTPVIATSSDLSTAAKAGIAVGVIGAALLGALAAWLVFGRRKINNMEPAAYPPVQNSCCEPVKVEQLYSHEVSGQPMPPETRQQY